jgi:uncharacterized protein (TIGR02466 family)
MSKPVKKTGPKNKKTAEKNPLVITSPFPTFTGRRSYAGKEGNDAFNDRLRTKIYRNKGQNPDGTTRSNTAGTWHSDVDLLKWINEPALAGIFQRTVLDYLNVYNIDPTDEVGLTLAAWAMVYETGGYSTVHTHPNAHFACVYYVDNPEQIETTMTTGVRLCPGEIEFVDTRGAQGMLPGTINMGTSFRLNPKAGDMLIFPAWLPHFVHPLVGDKDRICIACNATIVKHTKKG